MKCSSYSSPYSAQFIIFNCFAVTIIKMALTQYFTAAVTVIGYGNPIFLPVEMMVFGCGSYEMFH